MLVLTRLAGEEIVIGDNVVVRVCEVRGDKVRLGVTAPTGVPVHRKEVWLKIQEQANAGRLEQVGDPPELLGNRGS